MIIGDLIVDALIQRAIRTPFWHLPGLMERYWLVPFPPTKPGTESNEKAGKNGIEVCVFRERPIGWLMQQFDKAARIHHILRSDDVLHDHPWWYLTVILRGGYWEARPVYVKLFSGGSVYVGESRKWHGPGSILLRRHTDFHRLELPEGETTWTLFITGKWRHVWGFMPDPRTGIKIPYREYLGLEKAA